MRSLSGIYILADSLTMSSGTTMQVRYHIAGDAPQPVQLAWSVKNGTGSATIDAATGEITALLPGTVEVTVTCTAGGAEFGSDTRTITINPLALAEPPVAKTARDAVSLSWDVVEGAVGYCVERAQSAEGPYTALADIEDGTSYDDTTAPAGTEVFYRVAPYSSAAYKAQTGVFGDGVRGLRLSLVNELEAEQPATYTSMARFLQANGADVSSIVLASADDPLMLLEATCVAGVTDGIVVPVDQGGEALTSSLVALSSVDAESIIVLGGENAVSPEPVAALAEACEASVTRYGTDSSSANEIASAVIDAYGDAWASTALIIEPATATRCSDIASYAFAMHMPVLFANPGGATLPSAALVAAARFDEALLFGDTRTIPRSLEAMLKVKQVNTRRWAPDEQVAVSSVTTCVDEGLLSWDYSALYPRDDAAAAAMAASFIGQADGVALPLEAQDPTGALADTRGHGDDIACSFVVGDAAFCSDMAPSVTAAITSERADSELSVDVDTLGVMVGGDEDVELRFTGDGAVHVAISDANVATARYDADAHKITISGMGAGYATVTVSADEGAISNAPEPVEIHVAVARLDFLGGSLRNDAASAADGTSTAMRLGYEVELPNASLADSSVSWHWQYGLAADQLTQTKAGEYYVTDAQGGELTNLVFAGIPSARFDTSLYAQLTVSVKADDGREYAFTDAVRSRSASEVIEAILASPTSSAADRTYASALKAASGA